MPNHVKNELKILSDERDAVFAHMKTENSDFDFNRIIPMPDYVFDGDLPMEVKEILGKRFSWYGWCLDNWGTKWNAYSVERKADDTMTFETAWSGVMRLMILLCNKFKVKEATYRYSDEDFGCNCGGFDIHEGRITVLSIPGESKEAFDLASALRPEWCSHSEDEDGYYWDDKTGIEYRDVV